MMQFIDQIIVQSIVYLAAFALQIQCTGPQFSFIPSPNINVLQSAVYQCTVTDVGDGDIAVMQWRVNEISVTSNITSTGITVAGLGTLNTTLTIPGDSALNETTVKCIAFVLVNGEMDADIYNDSAILYIYGETASVDLYCSLVNVYEIQCNWRTIVIDGVNITGYNINITDSEDNLDLREVTDSEYYYNASQFGVYSISVAAVIRDELESEINTAMVEVPEVMIDEWLLKVYFVGDILRVNCTILNTMLNSLMLPCKFVLITTSQFNSIRVNYSLDIISYQNAMIIGSQELNFGKDKRDASIMVEYDSGFQVYSSDRELLSTFNVQNLTITSPSNGEVCFKCIYISGINDVPGCYIILNSSQSGSNLSLTIINEDMKCKSIVETNLYHILVYDIESNGTTYTQQPAYETSAMIIGMSSTTSVVGTPTQSSIPTGGIGSSIPIYIAVIGQGVVLIVSLIIIIALMMVVCMLYKKHKNNTNKRDEDVAIPLINRIDPNTNEPETGDAILDKPTQPVDSSKLYAELDIHKSPSELPASQQQVLYASQQQVLYADVRH